MKRKDFLKGMGLAGVGAMLPFSKVSAKLPAPPTICSLIPTETTGPYPLALSGTAAYWRADIRESQVGAPLTLTLKVNGVSNCGVLQNARVDVWHCNALGYYSGYTTSGQNGSINYGTARWLRGIQTTNANGEVTFTTNFPGWYSGRVIHIHFEVYTGGTVGSSAGWTLQKTSQFTFPVAEKNALLAANAPYSSYGPDPTAIASDNVFSDGASLQIATLVGSAVPYSSYLEVGVPGAGTVLPLELLGFSGGLKGQNALLWWRTTTEVNFSYFELEYSPDAEDFEFVSKITAKGREQTQVNDYMYEDVDRMTYGNAYYRLKMVDRDGSFAYSSMVVITSDRRQPIRIYPNPATDHVILSHGLLSGQEKVMIMDVQGREIGIGNLQADTEYTQIDLSLCKTGIHYLVFFDGVDTEVLKFMVK